MKKVMILAYTAHNLGDDLFIHLLCSRYAETEFYLYAPKKYKQTFAHLPNLHIIASDDLSKRMLQPFFRNDKRIAKHCDIVVYIGGSLFIENSHWEKTAHHIESLIDSEQPFFILGANFGPFRNGDFYVAYENIFKRCIDVSFRDDYSLKLFRHLPNVRQAADIVFGLERKRTNHTNNGTIVISVIYPSIRKSLASEDEAYFDAIKNIAIDCIENGHSILFMSFCQKENDDKAMTKILTLIPSNYKKYIRSYFYHLNIAEALSEIANAKAVIATRFHAMVLGWVYEKPVFPIVYSDKMKTVMDDSGFHGAYCYLSKLGKICPKKVLRLLLSEPFNVDLLRKNAQQHFAVLDTFLTEDTNRNT